jgi:hypothetical protein
MEKVPCFSFDQSSKTWQDSFIAGSVPLDRFSVITWNVWKDLFLKNERCVELLKALKENFATFVSLQEVEAAFLRSLLQDVFVQENYVVSSVSLSFEYDTVLLFRKDVAEHITLMKLPLPTKSGRTLYVFKVSSRDRTLLFCGSHLESLERNRSFRELQISKCLEILRAENASHIICTFFFFAFIFKTKNDWQGPVTSIFMKLGQSKNSLKELGSTTAGEFFTLKTDTQKTAP